MIMLLLLTVRPYIINRLVAFVREQVSVVWITVFRQQYKSPLSQEEADL